MLPWQPPRDVPIQSYLTGLDQQQPLAQQQQQQHQPQQQYHGGGSEMWSRGGGGPGDAQQGAGGGFGQAGAYAAGPGAGQQHGGPGGPQGQQGPGAGPSNPNGPNNQPGGPPGGMNSQPGGPGAPQPPITLPQVLHYLQTTHRNHLSMQNGWEIERAELRARVALLEGEKRSWEQAKTDLARRIRMLEWALKMERSKYLAQAQGKDGAGGDRPIPALAPARAAALRAAEGGSSSGSASGFDSPARAESPKLEDGQIPAPAPVPTPAPLAAPAASGAEATAAAPGAATSGATNAANVPAISVAAPAANALANVANKGATIGGRPGATPAAAEGGNGATWGGPAGGPAGLAMGAMMASGRDPKARARSRDYLKQCLQEINYLTSNVALNPLPQQSALIPGLERPRKALNDVPAPGGAGVAMNANGTNASAAAPQPPAILPFANAAAPSLIPRPYGADRALPSFDQQGQQQRDTVSGENANPTSAGATMAAAPSMTRSRSSSRPLGPISQVAMAPLASNPLGPPLASSLFSTPLASSTAPKTENAPASAAAPNGIIAGPSELNEGAADASTTAVGTAELSNGVSSSTSAFDDADEPNRLTAIYRPESSESWREQLRLAGEKEKERQKKLQADQQEKGSLSTTANAVKSAEEELAALTLTDPDAKGGESQGSLAKVNGNAIAGKDDTAAHGHHVWKPRRTLRSHLDAARCIAFDRAGLTVVSGSDDCTVKLWRLNAPSMVLNSRQSTWPETEPQVTLRGHSSTVTSVAISAAQGRIYSASLDATVQVWALPPAENETYAPYDPRGLLGTFVGHTDGIWDMALLPLRLRDEALLATASADGTVKVWSTDDLGSPLKLSWGYDGLDGSAPEDSSAVENGDKAEEEAADKDEGKPTPTTIAVVWTDLKKVAVAYSNAIIKIFELETGKAVMTLKGNETYDGTPATQVNKIVSHFTLPMIISAHEDRYIRLFDLATGACTHSMLGHLDAVTCLAVDPSGLALVSGGHDCSLRFWDLSTRTCVQEVSSHRTKAGEGVTDVAFHPTLPFMASSGADGTVKLFG